jgi:hypothetical protein
MEAIQQKQKSSPSSCYYFSLVAVAAVFPERRFEAYASPMLRLKNTMNNLAAGSTAGMAKRSFCCRHRHWGNEPSPRNSSSLHPLHPKPKRSFNFMDDG